MTNDEYIRHHANEDTRRLALTKAPEGIDLPFCLTQIEALRMARTKLPRWAETDGIVFPPRLAMEQCSSQPTACYKAQVVSALLPTEESRLCMADLTGGFGVDFSFLAPLFSRAIYVERQAALCATMRHNLPLLGIGNAVVQCAEASDVLATLPHQNLIYLDPARRDAAGRKVVALADCTPDVATLHDTLLEKADVAMLKLSPMLDISQTLLKLPATHDVHVVSVEGECKELLLVLSKEPRPLSFHCVNLGRTRQQFSLVAATAKVPLLADRPHQFLYEPNASILKAGVQDTLCEHFEVTKLHPFSHLFTSDNLIEGFPGRAFAVEAWSSFGKKELKNLLHGIEQANLTTRNFPTTVQELRRRLRLGEGGDTYLFATTLADGTHALIRCRKG